MPSLNDHDFPTPGYLINVSGYMVLEPKDETSDTTTNEFSLNIVHEEFLSTLGMYIQNPEPLINVLVSQLKSNTNIETEKNELCDVIISELEKQSEFYEKRFETSKDDMEKLIASLSRFQSKNSIVNLQIISTAISNIVCCKCVVIDLSEKSIHECCGRAIERQRESPIFLAVDDSLNVYSVLYTKEPTDDFTDGINRPLKYDEIGRLHIKTPHSGTSYIYLRAQLFNSTTVATHITDIYNIITHNELLDKPVLMLMCDGGPDFNPTSVLNMLYYYRLFKKLNLDCIVAFTYAARYSAYNCIEHLWSKLSNLLSGVVFSNKAQGDKKPPCQLSSKDVSAQEKKRKEKEVFDRAMKSMENGHWKSTSFDGYPVLTETVKCDEDELLYNDYERVKSFLKAPLREIHTFIDLQNEYQILLKHLDRHHNEIIFVKCTDVTCCGVFHSENIKSFLLKYNNRIPVPTKDTHHEGHFKTFLQMEKGSDYSYGDDEQPSVVKNAIGKCEFCPNYSFTSKTEKNRHMSVFHRRRKTTVSSKEFTCNFNNCGKMFTSRSCLNRHKNQFEHKERNAPKDPRNKSRRNPTKRLRKINEVLAQFDSDEEDSSDDDEEDTCSANPCKIQDDNSQSDVAWIQCDVCESWFHDFCISRGSNTDEFICKSCR